MNPIQAAAAAEAAAELATIYRWIGIAAVSNGLLLVGAIAAAIRYSFMFGEFVSGFKGLQKAVVENRETIKDDFNVRTKLSDRIHSKHSTRLDALEKRCGDLATDIKLIKAKLAGDLGQPDA